MPSDMSDDNFGPWIDWAGGECPISWAKAGEYEVRFRGEARGGKYCGALDYTWEDDDDGTIIAYRVRLPADDLLRQAIEALRVIQTSVSHDTIIGIKIAAVLALAAESGL